MHDYGTTLSLWVSAFEILSHPETRYGGKEEVLDLLGLAVFSEQKLRCRRYQVSQGKKKPPRQVTLVQKTYYEMNSARNDFLHGNPIKPSNLFPNRNKKSQPLTVFAPIIYKCALMAFLGLFERPVEELVPFQRCALEDALLRIRKHAEEDKS